MSQTYTDEQVVERILRSIAALTVVSYPNLKPASTLENLLITGAKLVKLTLWLKELRNREIAEPPRPSLLCGDVEQAKTVRGVVQLYFARVHGEELDDATADELIIAAIGGVA